MIFITQKLIIFKYEALRYIATG